MHAAPRRQRCLFLLLLPARRAMSEVEETLKRISSHKGVHGILIVNVEGVPIRSTLDPAIPLPMLIAVLFFTPRHVSHLVACGICLLGIGVSAWLVLAERGE